MQPWRFGSAAAAGEAAITLGWPLYDEALSWTRSVYLVGKTTVAHQMEKPQSRNAAPH